MPLMGPVGLEAPPSISSQVARTFVTSSAYIYMPTEVDRAAPGGRAANYLASRQMFSHRSPVCTVITDVAACSSPSLSLVL